MDLLFYSFGLSLFDSLSTSLQIVLFVLLLTTENPVRNAFWYLAGLSGAYFVCGMAGYLALDSLRAWLAQWVPSSNNVPDAAYYQAEMLTGLILVLAGAWYYRRQRKAPAGRTPSWFVAKLKNMNHWFAFGAGVLMSVTSFPTSVPYLAVLGRYWSLQFSAPMAALYILFYNLGYALPMIIIFGFYLRLRRRTEGIHDLLHEKARMLNVHLTTWSFAGFGIFCLLDSLCYSCFGRGLLKGRFF